MPAELETVAAPMTPVTTAAQPAQSVWFSTVPHASTSPPPQAVPPQQPILYPTARLNATEPAAQVTVASHHLVPHGYGTPHFLHHLMPHGYENVLLRANDALKCLL